jgi:hypothetical protein
MLFYLTLFLLSSAESALNLFDMSSKIRIATIFVIVDFGA